MVTKTIIAIDNCKVSSTQNKCFTYMSAYIIIQHRIVQGNQKNIRNNNADFTCVQPFSECYEFALDGRVNCTEEGSTENPASTKTFLLVCF